MIQLKLFDSQKPTESKKLKLTPEINGECLIGSSPKCDIALSGSQVSSVHGSICFLEGQYYFTDRAGLGSSQFNDEDVEAGQKYLLQIDDIIRIGEFVLIVEAVLSPEKTARRDEELATVGGGKDKTQNQTPEDGKRAARTLQDIKFLLKKNPQADKKITHLVVPLLLPKSIAKLYISQGDQKTSQRVDPCLPSSPRFSPKIYIPQGDQKNTEQVAFPLLPKFAPKKHPPHDPKTAARVASTLSPKEDMPVAQVPPDRISRWTKGDLTVRCVGAIDETHDVKTFRFAADPPMLFTYKPGQFVTLNLEINGKPVKRSYSISSTPSRPHTLEITVKRVPPPAEDPDAPPGLVSNWLHDNIKAGSEIKLSGPWGKFTCFDNPAQKLLLISAGSGITPMISMSRWFLDTAADCDIVFFHCARSPRDIIFRQELELMSSRHSKFRPAIATTRLEPGQAWWGLTGRLNENMVHAIAPDFKERTVYVCGPNAFMQGVKTMLESLGFPMQNYFEESFGGSKKGGVGREEKQEENKRAVREGGAPLRLKSRGEDSLQASDQKIAPPSPPSTSTSSYLVFAKSGKEIFCEGQDSILELAEQEEIEISSSCRSGVCGTCKVRKLKGEVQYEGNPDALDDSEQEEGYILTCIARPIGQVVIEA